MDVLSNIVQLSRFLYNTPMFIQSNSFAKQIVRFVVPVSELSEHEKFCSENLKLEN